MNKPHRTTLAAVTVAAAIAGGGLAAAATANAQPSAATRPAAAAWSGGQVGANERVVGKFLRQVIDEHRGSAVAALVTPDVSWHGGTLGVVSGRAAVTGLFTGIVTALPNLHSTVYDVIGQGNQVVVRQVLAGTQKEAVIGIPASGRSVSWNAVDLFILRDGKISQMWAGDDWTAILYDTGTYKAPWIK